MEMGATPEQEKMLGRVFDSPALPPRPSEFERNSEKIAALEQQRVGLGPLRRIKFTMRFQKKAFAERFVEVLDLEGWRIDIDNRGSNYEWFVSASKPMKPTAEAVTEWSEYFRNHPVAAQKYHEGGGFSHGWEYCDRQDLTFSTSEDFDVEPFAAGRADVLFGMGLAEDRLNGRTWNTWPADKAPAFRLHPAEFIRHARARRPADPYPTASGFSQWLYSLYANAQGSAEDWEDGKDAEQAISNARLRAYGSIDCDSVRSEFPEWTLVYNGLHLQDEKMSGYYKIGALPVSGRPLRASPDLVFRNALTGEVLIVEIKHSRMPIPENLWPNIWGQLWCYAQVEMARDAPKVTVVGEIWGDGWAKHSRRLVCLRGSVRRDPRAPAYDRFFRTLFDIYRGVL